MSEGPREPGELDSPDEPDVPVDGPETVAEHRLLASFGRRAREANLERVAQLVRLLDASDAGSLDEAGRTEAESLAHQVVGSAGTFGWPAASVLAVQVEAFFAEESEGDADTVRGALGELRAQLRD